MQNKLQDRTLAYQIITFIFVFLLIIFIASILVTRFLFQRVMLDNAEENLSHLAHETINQIDGRLEKVQTLSRSVLLLISQKSLDDSELNTYFYNLINEHRELISITLASRIPDSDVFRARIIYNERNSMVVKNIPGDSYTYQDWFLIPYLTQKRHWSEPWYDSNGPEKMVVSLCLPFFENGKVVGILRFDTELRVLQSIVSPLKVKKNGYAFLLSNTGTIVTHPADSLVMNESIFSLAESNQDEQLRKIGRSMIAGETDFVRLKKHSLSKNFWMYYSPIHTNRWCLAIMIAHNDVLKDLNMILIIQILVSILSFLTISVIVYSRTLSIAKPLSKFTEIAERIGKGDFDTVLPDGQGTYEIEHLSQSFAAMQDSLKEYIHNLQITNQEKNRIIDEVKVASEVQKNLIPTNKDHPYNKKELRVYGILEPAGDIGGDLYDYFMIDDTHFCFVIADVAGKGIVASMTMTIVSTFLRSIGNFYHEAREITSALNVFLCKNNVEANFVTTLLGVIDLDSGRLQFSNAGHVPLLIRKVNGSYKKYSTTQSTAVGIFEDIKIGQEELQLDPGDELILFTDGITEAMNSKEEFLGIAGVEGIVQNLGLPNPKNDALTILDSVHSFARNAKQHDDITILVIDYKHPQRYEGEGLANSARSS